MTREEQAQLCALLAELRFDIGRITINQPDNKTFTDAITMINKIMSFCIMPDDIKVKKWKIKREMKRIKEVYYENKQKWFT